MNKEKIAEALNCIPKTLKTFEEEDPFNPGNIIKGVKTTQNGLNYGSLYITHINGRECPQIIAGTPKLRSPFNKMGQFKFPKTKKIKIYEKYDGTNICAYKYYDQYIKKYFVSYKTRLTPFLHNGKWNPFLDMWNEMLIKYPKIPKTVLDSDYNYYFELYGNRNVILIQYKNSLDTILLFVRNTKSGNFEISPPPEDIKSFPVANFISDISSKKDHLKASEYFENEYNANRRDIESRITHNEDETLSGEEGYVWYLLDEEDIWHQYKCKPPSIEQIHWASGGLSSNVIKTTALNVLEQQDEITVEATIELLKEEFDDYTINKSYTYIGDVVARTIDKLNLRNTVIDNYHATGLDITKDKGGVMRAMSVIYEKHLIRKVFYIIKHYS